VFASDAGDFLVGGGDAILMPWRYSPADAQGQQKEFRRPGREHAQEPKEVRIVPISR
jgi:hypothetical protein